MTIRGKGPAHSCRTYLRLCVGGDHDNKSTEQMLDAFTKDWRRLRDGEYEIANNEIYDVDINNMIRKTVRAFIGREKEVKQLLKRLGAQLYLEVVPHIYADSERPKPILSLNADNVAFLYKSGILFDLDYYIV